MEESFKKELADYGVDLEMTLYRFLGKEEMYERFLHKFMDEKSYFELLESVGQKDYDKAFRSAHTLKGVAANLGIEAIRESASRITEALRNKQLEEIDVAELEKMTEQLKEAYAVLQNIMEKYTK